MWRLIIPLVLAAVAGGLNYLSLNRQPFAKGDFIRVSKPVAEGDRLLDDNLER